ncbi:Serine-threonine kinase receptor-associated protein [Fragariocoptes setiger]|uniref:Serine-threonine kinase receptor-associated protein n=1 Tax=Fragariocoptes setiger TaxID=1670756 RepID=A0ABQ7SC17_9ACAR|nr:Serine-threonine kinase receptor-associated protein [Fragariocoptes setiger]
MEITPALQPNSIKQLPIVCSGHTRPVVDLAFSKVTSEGQYYLISACKDGKPMLRQGNTGDWIGTFQGHKGAVWGVSLTDDATKAATGSADFEAKIWSTADGQEVHSFTCSHIVRSVNFSSDQARLLVSGSEKSSKIFDLTNYTNEPIIYTGHEGSVRHALFYDNDKRFVTASEDKTVRFWDVASNLEIKRVEFKQTPVSMELSVNKTVLTVCCANKVSFWSVLTMEKIKEFEMPTQILSASIHPENLAFIYGGENCNIYKCDFMTGAELESFKGHFGPVHCVRFSPDGELYASGSEDGTVRLWQTTVGKTYGLWAVQAEPATNSVM